MEIDKVKYCHLKLLKIKLLALLATPEKFPGGSDDGLPRLFRLCADRYGNITV